MVQFTMENGLMDKNMDSVKNGLWMDNITKDIILMMLRMEKEEYITQMGLIMKGNF